MNKWIGLVGLGVLIAFGLILKNGIQVVSNNDTATVSVPNPSNNSALSTAQPVTHKHSATSADSAHSQVSSNKNSEILLPENLKKVLQERLKNNTSSDGLIEETLPDGSKMMDLQGRFQHMPVAIVGKDGEIVVKEYYTSPE
jgi:hypothetical protein